MNCEELEIAACAEIQEVLKGVLNSPMHYTVRPAEHIVDLEDTDHYQSQIMIEVTVECGMESHKHRLMVGWDSEDDGIGYVGGEDMDQITNITKESTLLYFYWDLAFPKYCEG